MITDAKRFAAGCTVNALLIVARSVASHAILIIKLYIFRFKRLGGVIVKKTVDSLEEVGELKTIYMNH